MVSRTSRSCSTEWIALREQARFFHARGLDDVSGNALKRAFLILRQLRPRIVASGDQAHAASWQPTPRRWRRTFETRGNLAT